MQKCPRSQFHLFFALILVGLQVWCDRQQAFARVLRTFRSNREYIFHFGDFRSFYLSLLNFKLNVRHENAQRESKRNSGASLHRCNCNGFRFISFEIRVFSRSLDLNVCEFLMRRDDIKLGSSTLWDFECGVDFISSCELNGKEVRLWKQVYFRCDANSDE